MTKSKRYSRTNSATRALTSEKYFRAGGNYAPRFWLANEVLHYAVDAATVRGMYDFADLPLHSGRTVLRSC